MKGMELLLLLLAWFEQAWDIWQVGCCYGTGTLP